MDPGTATLLAAIIGAIGAVIAGIVGHRSGVKKGRRHSILQFLDVYEKDLKNAVEYLDRGFSQRATNKARAIVENVKVWRKIQKSFEEALNGQVNSLDSALQTGNEEDIKNRIRELYDAFEGRRLLVETQLKKSQI